MLYVDGAYVTVNGKTCYNNSTQCICLLSAYLEKIGITLVVVLHDSVCLKDRSPQTGFKLPSNCFKEIVFRSYESIDANVKNVCLPVIYEEDQRLVISGLCHVLRFLVKHASNLVKQEFLQLLGHKRFCLKATSEVSSRTHLCEVIGPGVIDNWTAIIANTSSGVPDPLLQIEKLLNEPVSIHNRDKRQRVVLKKLARATLTSHIPDEFEPEKKVAKLYRTNLNAKLAVRTNDLPPLEHVFVEGVELTLTDLALFPLVHAFFSVFSKKLNSIQENLSSTWLWYNRVWKIEKISCAANLTGVTIVTSNEFGADLLPLHVPSRNTEILRLGDKGSINSKKLKRKELEKTIRRDLPTVLEKVSAVKFLLFEQLEKESIELNWKSYPVEVHPVEGELSSKRAARKCHQIENLFYCVNSMCKDGDTIVDFCAGGGHVGIVIAYLLPRCNVIVLDNKEESLDRARKRICALRLNNVTIYQCNLQNFRGSFDIGVALHACGVATDMVLQQCLQVDASFAISPCCYGKIQKTESISYPQSKLYQENNIDYDSMVLLGHAADQTSWDFEGEKPKQGKRCMEFVDADRASYARDCGYRTCSYTMQPRDCSPKNNLIVGFSSKLKKLQS